MGARGRGDRLGQPQRAARQGPRQILPTQEPLFHLLEGRPPSRQEYVLTEPDYHTLALCWGIIGRILKQAKARPTEKRA